MHRYTDILLHHVIYFETDFITFELFLEIQNQDSKLSLTINKKKLSSDENLHIRLNRTARDEFWVFIKTEYPELSKIPTLKFIPYEMAFSFFTVI